MKKILKSCLIALPLLLTACESGEVQETLGINKQAPDEFTVVSRPPLSMPPEFNLRPPRPGEPPLGAATDEQARSLLTGKPATKLADPSKLEAPTVDTAVTPVIRNDALSGGANSLLKRAGGDAANDNIRAQLATDAVTPADTSTAQTLLDKIDGAEKNEPVVDPKKEAERLRDNKDKGKPVTEGETPTQKTGKKSLIDRIF